MRLLFHIGVLSLSFWCFAAQAGSDNPVRIITSHLPPYSIENQKQAGYIHEIVQLIEQRLGTNRIAQFYPWPRAQNIVQNNDNLIIFPLTRTEKPEKNYDWLIDVYPIEYVFFTLGDKPITLEEARKLERISVQQSTPFQQFLENLNFKNLIATPEASEAHFRLLTSKRVQAWFTAKSLGQYALIKKDLTPDIQISDPVGSSRLYIATSKKFPVELKKEYQRIFEELVKEGQVEALIKKYQ